MLSDMVLNHNVLRPGLTGMFALRSEMCLLPPSNEMLCGDSGISVTMERTLKAQQWYLLRRYFIT